MQSFRLSECGLAAFVGVAGGLDVRGRLGRRWTEGCRGKHRREDATERDLQACR